MLQVSLLHIANAPGTSASNYLKEISPENIHSLSCFRTILDVFKSLLGPSKLCQVPILDGFKSLLGPSKLCQVPILDVFKYFFTRIYQATSSC